MEPKIELKGWKAVVALILLAPLFYFIHGGFRKTPSEQQVREKAGESILLQIKSKYHLQHAEQLKKGGYNRNSYDRNSIEQMNKIKTLQIDKIEARPLWYRQEMDDHRYLIRVTYSMGGEMPYDGVNTIVLEIDARPRNDTWLVLPTTQSF